MQDPLVRLVRPVVVEARMGHLAHTSLAEAPRAIANVGRWHTWDLLLAHACTCHVQEEAGVARLVPIRHLALGPRAALVGRMDPNHGVGLRKEQRGDGGIEASRVDPAGVRELEPSLAMRVYCRRHP